MIWKKYKGANRETTAAIRIQSEWRCYKGKNSFKQLKVIISKTQKIQNAMRLWLNVKRTKEVIRKKEEAYNEQYQLLQEMLLHNWSRIKREKRVEVHIASLNIPNELKNELPNYNELQNS